VGVKLGIEGECGVISPHLDCKDATYNNANKCPDDYERHNITIDHQQILHELEYDPARPRARPVMTTRKTPNDNKQHPTNTTVFIGSCVWSFGGFLVVEAGHARGVRRTCSKSWVEVKLGIKGRVHWHN
jgi:hypothetical protein